MMFLRFLFSFIFQKNRFFHIYEKAEKIRHKIKK